MTVRWNDATERQVMDRLNRLAPYKERRQRQAKRRARWEGIGMVAGAVVLVAWAYVMVWLFLG